MTSFHFDVGNSDQGPMGFCARITAPSPAEALIILRKALQGFEDGLDITEYARAPFAPSEQAQVEYVTVYLNAGNVRKHHIDEEEEIND